jgi:hypothetical protein
MRRPASLTEDNCGPGAIPGSARGAIVRMPVVMLGRCPW